MISKAAITKNEVIDIIKNDDGRFINHEQFCFACGYILTKLIEDKVAPQSSKNAYRANILKQDKTIKQLKGSVVKLIKDNFEWIASMTQTYKNIYAFVLMYDDSDDNIESEAENCLHLGLVTADLK